MLTENERDILRFLDDADQNGELVEYLGAMGGAHLKLVDGPQGPHCSNKELTRLEEFGYVGRTPQGQPVYLHITDAGREHL